MSILVTPSTKVLVQGITGSFGAKHAQLSIDYGTHIVAGVTPGKGGQFFEHGGKKIPIFDTVADAVKQTGATASAVFVPPPFAADAILEGADAGLELVVAITEGIPVRDMVRVKRALQGDIKTRLIGQSTCVGIGGDPVNGTSHLDVIKLFNDDPETTGIIMIGEIGGSAEEEAAEWIRANCKKPVAGFIAGATAPPGRRMGHAGAIVSGGKGTAAAKIASFKAAGIGVAATPSDMAGTMVNAKFQGAAGVVIGAKSPFFIGR